MVGFAVEACKGLMMGVNEESIVIRVCAGSEGMRRIVVIKDSNFIGDVGVERVIFVEVAVFVWRG